MKNQMETFSFSPIMNLVEEGKWLLAVTSFEATNSLFNMTDENNGFSFSIPNRWRILKYLPHGIFDKLKDLLKPRSEKDIDLNVAELEKRGNQMLIRDQK